MTLDEKYRYRCNKSRINISVYIVIAMLSFFAVTTARYTKASSGSSVINVAKWNIEINGFSNQNQIEIPITKEGNSLDDIIRNGDTGYFDIVIDPDETEVSVEYSINVSFVKESSLLSSYIEFESYSLNNGSKIDLNGSTAINGEINLNGKSCLDSSDVKTYRIYWRWIGDDLVNNPDESSINANVQVKQKI